MAEDLDKKENVIIGMMSLVAGECAVTVLPQFGGKISSIKIGERELLQPPACLHCAANPDDGL